MDFNSFIARRTSENRAYGSSATRWSQKHCKVAFEFFIALRFHEMCFNFSNGSRKFVSRVCEISDATSKTILSE